MEKWRRWYPPAVRRRTSARRILEPSLLLALAMLVVAGPHTASGSSAQEPERASRPVLANLLQPREEPASEERVELGSPASRTEIGPLFALRPIVQRLGGSLSASGGSLTLTLGTTRVVAGTGNPVMIVGRQIVRLSQPPIQGEGADDLLVPLDFLRESYGKLASWIFEQSPGDGALVAVRREARAVPVGVDVVHLQGVTTVVLQFPQPVGHQVVTRGASVEVRVSPDRLEVPASPVVVDDPLVRRIAVLGDRVEIDLAAGASAESYVLERPYRVVVDVVEADELEVAEEVDDLEVEPPRQRAGINTIVVDPGHGGSESGAVGAGGEAEKDLTLALARALRDRLRDRMPVKVLLTRDADSQLDLEERAAIANQNKADLFVSIHLNSALGEGAHGAETYFLSMEASDARAARRAEAENVGVRRAVATDGGSPLYDLELILWDLAQSHHLAESQRLAGLIQEELNGALGLRDRGVKQAPFRVLMGAAMPAVLVELGFLSNPDEETKLRQQSYREELVEALVRAIDRYRGEVGEQAADDAAAERPAAETSP